MDQEEMHIDDIKKRSVRGGLILTARRAILKSISLLTFIALGWFLSQEEFGVFAIASFIVAFFAYFSDVGLAAAIVQKKEKLTTLDLRTTFTIQQLLVFSITVVLVLTAPFIVESLYKNKLDPAYVTLIQALGISLILASLKSLPSALLERRLQFDKLVIPEVVETLLYNGILVAMAWLGYGVWSFIWAMLARGIVGTVITYILCPWPIGFAFDKKVAKKLFSFGVPFQLNSFIALIKDNVVPTFVAGYLGTAAVGNINWAQKYAFLPLEILNDIIRVTFPAYSRIQHDKALLSRTLEKSIFLIALVLYPMLAGVMALMPWITQFILNPKWLPALPVFYLLCVNTLWASVSTTFTNALFAIGHSKVVLRYMVIWTILTWTLIPFCVYLYNDIIGVGIAQALIACTSIGVILETKRYIDVKVLPQIIRQLLFASVMGIIVYFYALNYVSNIWMLFTAILLGFIVYIALLMMFMRQRTLTEIQKISNIVFKKVLHYDNG